MWKKGEKLFWEGRAYNFRWIDDTSTRHFRFLTKRTMKKGKMVVHVAFDQDSKGKWQVRSATCMHCQAGRHTGFCHHLVTGLTGLTALKDGLIVAGEVNHGKMHWGLKQCNDERHHVPTSQLAVLAGEECKVVFAGVKSGTTIVSCMQDYLQEVAAEPGMTMVQQLYSRMTANAGWVDIRAHKRKLKRDASLGRVLHARKRLRFQHLVQDLQNNQK